MKEQPAQTRILQLFSCGGRHRIFRPVDAPLMLQLYYHRVIAVNRFVRNLAHRLYRQTHLSANFRAYRYWLNGVL